MWRSLLGTTSFAQSAQGTRRRQVRKRLLTPFRRLALRASRRATAAFSAVSAVSARDRLLCGLPSDGMSDPYSVCLRVHPWLHDA
jgi:hypothetical protein